MSKPTPRLDRIIGNASDPEIAERLHRLDHAGRVDRILLCREDMARHRLRVRSDGGQDYALLLPRQQRLENGSVLRLDETGAIVVRMAEENWLSVVARDSAAALELGYFAGNMHWRVRFDGPRLRIALEGPEQDYLDRLAPMLADRRIRTESDE